MSTGDEDMQSLIDAYLRNELDEQQATEFEIRLLDDPDFLKEVEFQEAYVQALKASASLLQTESPEGRWMSISFLDWIRQPVSVAACLIIVLSSSVALQSLYPPAQAPGYRLTTVPVVVDIGGSTRGGEVAISAPLADSGRYLLRVDVGFAGANLNYRVQLGPDSERAVPALSTTHTADGLGLLTLFLEGDFSGEQELLLELLDDAGAVVDSRTVVIGFTATR